jgi:hypothetical protein
MIPWSGRICSRSGAAVTQRIARLKEQAFEDNELDRKLHQLIVKVCPHAIDIR